MAKRQPPRNAAKEALWRERLEEQEASGLSQVAFCKLNKLNPNTFSSWKQIIQERNAEQEREVERVLKKAAANRAVRAEKASFVPLVPVQAQPPAPPAVPPRGIVVAEIEVTGIRVRVFEGADARTLCAVIRAMRESEHAR